MPKTFGYLNQNNPMTIGDAEAQVMMNCSIERGWIEHKDYPQHNSADMGTPCRMVRLPNGNQIFISNTSWGASHALQERILTRKLTKIASANQTLFLFSTTYFYSMPDILIKVNGGSYESPDDYTFSLSETTKGYLTVTWNGASFSAGDVVEFEVSDTEDRFNNTVSMGASFPSDSSTVIEFTKQLANRTMCKNLDTVKTVADQGSYTFKLYEGGQSTGTQRDYKTSTKQRFGEFFLAVDYGGGNVVYYNKDNYSFLPETDSTGVETGNVCLIFNYAPQTANGEIIFTCRYYPDYDTRYFVDTTDNVDKTIFYAVTVCYSHNSVNADDTENEEDFESAPEFFDIEFDSTNYGTMYNIKIVPKFPTSDADRTKTYHKIRVYRMPYGGSEYLFDREFDIRSFRANERAVPVISNEVFDGLKDDELGINDDGSTTMLETETNTQIPNTDTSIMSIEIYKDMLFVAVDKLVYFSRTGIYYQFPASNFLSFSDKVTGFCKHYSNLMIFTEKEAYVLYGDDAESFKVDAVDYRIDTDFDNRGNEVSFTVNSAEYHKGTSIINSAQSVYSRVVTLARNHASLSGRTAVLLVNNRYAYNITSRVQKFVDSMLPSKNGSSYYVADAGKDNTNRNRKFENKYYVAEFRKVTGDTDNAHTDISLVYDVLNDGFCLYKCDGTDSDGNGYFTEDSTNIYFKYRTKEFKNFTTTPQSQYHKGVYVKGCGDFKVNIYGDNELVSSFTYTEPASADRTALKIIFRNMANKRYSTVSLEFVGLSADAQIHDWEVYN